MLSLSSRTLDAPLIEQQSKLFSRCPKFNSNVLLLGRCTTTVIYWTVEYRLIVCFDSRTNRMLMKWDSMGARLCCYTHTHNPHTIRLLSMVLYTRALVSSSLGAISSLMGVFDSVRFPTNEWNAAPMGHKTIVFSTSTRWTRPIDSWNSLVCYTLLRFKYWTSILRTLIGSWCRLPLSIQKFCTYARQQWQPKHENTEEQEIYCNDIFDDSLAWRWNLELKTILFAPKNTCAVFFHLQKCYIIFVSTVLNRTAATRAKFGVLCSWECSSELMSIAAVRPRHIHTRTQCPLQMVY